MNDRSDEELISNYFSGEERAFAELLERHISGVYSFAVRYVGSEHDAEDITQETFTKAWKHLGTFNPAAASFKTWLMRIARNTCVDFLRKRKSVPLSMFDSDDGNTLADSLSDESPLPEELSIRAEERDTLEREIRLLPAPQREIVLMYIGSGMTFEDIGAALETSPNTVKSRYRRALLSLKERLPHQL